MPSRWIFSALLGAVLVAAGTTAVVGFSSFLGAPQGQPVAFTPVPLPPVSIGPSVVGPPASGAAATTGGVSALPVQGLALWPFGPSPWTPPLSQLLNGNTLITSEAQMRDVWKQLFRQPYDASRFDFAEDFVVLMGGGQLQLATFSITSVESVAAEYDASFGGSRSLDPLLSVTATTVFPGAFPQDPPPYSWVVSAVRVSRDELDDVAFHRTFIALP